MKIRAPDEIRVLDAEGFKRRAACLCLRDAPKNINNSGSPGAAQQKEILLISSAKNHDKWLVPGGGVDPGEDVAAAAMRETFEEAGVRGKLDGFVGLFETTTGTRTRTHVFKLIVEELADTWLESSRKRKWFPLEEAKRLLQCYKPAQREYLEKYSWQLKTQWDLRCGLRVAVSNGNIHKTAAEDNEGLQVKDLQIYIAPQRTKEPHEQLSPQITAR